MSAALSFTREVPVPGVVELYVRGDVDLAGGKRLQHELCAAVGTGEAVLVNLADCTFLDSSGLGALIRTAREVDSPGRFAVYCLPAGIVRQVFSLTRARTLLAVHADRDGALATLAP